MKQNGNNWQKEQQHNSGTQWQQDMANCNEKIFKPWLAINLWENICGLDLVTKVVLKFPRPLLVVTTRKGLRSHFTIYILTKC